MTDPRPHDYYTELAGLKKQLDEMHTQLTTLSQTVNHLVHGNGRQGYYTLLDDFYSPRDRSRSGALDRLARAEARVGVLENQRREIIVYLRGLAAGITLVGVDILFGFNIVNAIRSAFGA